MYFKYLLKYLSKPPSCDNSNSIFFNDSFNKIRDYDIERRFLLINLNNTIKNISSLGYKIDTVDKVLDEDPVNLWNAEFYAGVGTRLKSVIENSPTLIDPAVLEVLKVAINQKMNDYYSLVFQRYGTTHRMTTVR